MGVWEGWPNKSQCHRNTVHLQASGSVDLTGAKLVLTVKEHRDRFLKKVDEVSGHATVNCAGRPVRFHFVLTTLLNHLTIMYGMWSNRKLLTPGDLAVYTASLRRFHDSWVHLQWKPTLWVHWVCSHSAFFLNATNSLSAFSSIPTEYRHQKFKRDLKNTAQSFRYLNPDLCKGYLQRVIELDALDMGLRLLELQPQGSHENILGKRKRI